MTGTPHPVDTRCVSATMPFVDTPPADLDDARRAAAAADQGAEAFGHLTPEVAMHLEFHELVAYKNLLKRFFSAQPWSEDDAERLSALVGPHLDDGDWWEHQLTSGVTLAHGMRDGTYVLWVTGGAAAEPSLFDRVFAGPVVPEATPHPRKVKFNVGGAPAPGVWYRRGDDLDDPRVADLMADERVTDVMVAGDFVTVGLDRRASWEDELDPMLARVTELFHDPNTAVGTAPARTRDELVAEGKAARPQPRPEALHLLDPDDPTHRARLEAAANHDDARIRRVALVTLAASTDADLARRWLSGGYGDPSRLVRRAAIDAAADREDEELRPLLRQALHDADAWTRWKAVRALRELGVAPGDGIEALAEDPDFQVRMEVASVMRP